jgi:hypothetical protein
LCNNPAFYGLTLRIGSLNMATQPKDKDKIVLV